MKLQLKATNLSYDFEKNKNLINEIKLIEKIINEYEKLDDITKYNLIRQFCDLFLKDEDIIELINLKFNKNFNKSVCIPTKMEYDYMVQEGHGRDFSWWTVKKRIMLNCAIDKNFILENKNYSYDEIMNLINEKKIYPIYYNSKEINKFSEDKEECKNISCFIPNEIEVEKDIFGSYELLSIKDENINLLMKQINRIITPAELFNGLKTYTLELIKSLHKFEYIWYPEGQKIKQKFIKLYNENFKNRTFK